MSLALKTGGAVIGAVGKKVSMVGRCWIVVIGAVIKLSTYGIVFVNIPRRAVFGHTSEEAYIESQSVDKFYFWSRCIFKEMQLEPNSLQ